jgi:3',5'-cyclic AMP phosphodiesterase CpdA
MNSLKLFFLPVMIFICTSCSKDQFFNTQNQLIDDAVTFKSSSPKVKVAVISDIHYLDPTLMPDDYVSNTDFQLIMAGDRKLIELCDPIFRKAMEEIITERPDILLISGDLSFNGELASHTTMVGLLQEIENADIRVYVIPGNNDIRSPEAKSYKTIPASTVANITPGQFADLYQNFGYSEAIDRDDQSLSYICQPFSNLWILGIDACKYVLQPDGTFKVKPDLNPATLAWIQEKMVEANDNNIRVLAMMHYGIMEHYSGQYGLEGGLIKNYTANADSLIKAGIRLTFTGHFHGNDVTEYAYEGKTLTDIETGSLVTPASPYRIMTLDDAFLKVESRHITEVDAIMPGGLNFLTYSDSTINNRLDQLFTKVAMNMFGHSLEEAQIIAPFISRAWMAHFAGDEKISPEETRDIAAIAEFANPALIGAIKSIWTDLPLYSDNKIHIKLK